MGPPAKLRAISQDAFDEMVKENIDDLGMDPTEALEDAVQTLTLQGVDLSGIVQCIPGESSVDDNPVIQTLTGLNRQSDGEPGEILGLLGKLNELCGDKESENAAIAARNGGLALVVSILPKLHLSDANGGLELALGILVSLLYDLQSTETFRENGGPKIVMDVLYDESLDTSILNSGFSVVAVAAAGNEVLKELFMELKIDELIVKILGKHSGRSLPCVYDAIRVLLTADDNRVLASQVFGYARTFAKLGIVDILVNTLHEGLTSPCVVSASIALKSVAVNDEICRSVADSGGIDSILSCIDDSGELGNKIVAKSCCTLLLKLAGSDVNKSVIVEKSGMPRLIKLAGRFSEDPSVIAEIMSLISGICLRSPENAANAVEAGAGDIAVRAMLKFPEAELMQRNACLMIRNLAARNAENRSILLGYGLEKLIRKAKASHKICKEAATDALRDLGLDNYNA